MALLFCDGFDHYASADIPAKYSSVVGAWTVGATGRTSNGITTSSSPSNSLCKSIPSSSTLIAGVASKSGAGGSSGILFQFSDSTAPTSQIAIQINTSYQIFVSLGNVAAMFYSGGTILGVSAPIYSQSTYYYIEAKVVFSTTTTGSVTVKVNGNTVIALTGIRTTVSSNAFANTVYLGAPGAYQIGQTYDDYYICDGTGSANNDFLGNISVATLYPTGAGRVTGFTNTGGASNNASVANSTPDGDTSYVDSGTASTVDAYTLGTLSATGKSVVGVQLVADAKNQGSPNNVLSVGVGNGTTESFDSGTAPPSGSYGMITRTLDTNPLTSAAWAVADFATLQAALKVIS
jgi:hypothetical protein